MKSMLILGLVAALTVAARADVATGEAAPDFTLKDINGKDVHLADYKGKYVVLEWVNHTCPFVRKHYGTGNMQSLQSQYTAKGVTWLSICSSAEGKEGYKSPDEWKTLNEEKKGKATDILLDSEGTVGKMYGAKTTPNMVVINPDGKIVYQGAIDDRATPEPDDVPLANNYVKAALDAAMAGKPVAVGTTKSYGCGVKYK